MDGWRPSRNYEGAYDSGIMSFVRQLDSVSTYTTLKVFVALLTFKRLVREGTGDPSEIRELRHASLRGSVGSACIKSMRRPERSGLHK
jgi:hypothetical protein